MDRRACDRLTVTLDWCRGAALCTDIQRAAEQAGGWEYELRRAFLQLWNDLRPLLVAGWVLDGELTDAIAWQTLQDGRGRLLRTGCTVRLWRPPSPIPTFEHAPSLTVADPAP
jgi:hypothetical protein